MSISQKVSKWLDKLWAEEEMCDLTVQIGDVSIKCHSIILAACSPFFLGLLRSGMKEANEGRVVLQNISVSTFQLILKSLYTGEDVLSIDNFIEIWHAVDMLQIEFLVELCETFATKNIKLENFSEIFSTANLFNSKLVLSSVRTFMIQNFKSIYTSKRFLELSFDEMCFIVSSHGLHFNSEDPVIGMVLNWAENKHVVKGSEAINHCTGNNKKFKTLEPAKSFGSANLKYIPPKCSEDKSTTEANSSENQLTCELTNDSIAIPVRLGDNTNPTSAENLSTDRFDQLNILLKLVRTCIMSPSLLVNVLEHHLIKSNDKAREIIFSALLMQTSFRHGQWPTAGIYRQFHEYGNFCVTYVNDTGKFLMIDPLEEKRYTIKSCPQICKDIQLIAFDKELFAASRQCAYSYTSGIFVYRDNSWTFVTEVTGVTVLLASNDQFIYIIKVFANIVCLFRLNPKRNPPINDFITLLQGRYFVTHVMSYQIYLLIFCNETVNGVEETAVHILDLQDESWTKLDNLSGPAKNIISFRNDDNHFVLQTNGNLWVLRLEGETITFTHEAKLWNLDHYLYGAVVYGDELVIFYEYLENGPKDTFVSKLDNTFRSVSYYKLASSCSNLIPFVLPKYCLSKY
ncbi:uncharacterized protein LOC131951701 [Physella acuta]|uniref:uncharacterized protein LOC131951701 n=1 Tax=Physella acuta TaxID=109671 RepID=UPI0027DB229E|nr:uncharacterized protein LOC131951701 [Physella acuta]